jgi:succinoglycan biosynthesis transport protein ExoP
MHSDLHSPRVEAFPVPLIDAGLRRPKLAEYLGIEDAIGLSDVLINRVILKDAQQWGRNRLAVLSAGTVPPNPSVLLGSRAMSKRLPTLESDFDFTTITAPLLPVTDATADRIDRGELSAAISTLETVGARISGVILTMLPAKGLDAYGYGQYGYSGSGYAAHAAVIVRRNSRNSRKRRHRADA